MKNVSISYCHQDDISVNLTAILIPFQSSVVKNEKGIILESSEFIRIQEL